MTTFDVFINLEESAEVDPDPVLDLLRARDWDVSEPLSPDGIRRISKALSDHYSLQNELRPILGNEMHMNLVGGDDAFADLIRGLSQQAGDSGSTSKVVVVPRNDPTPADGRSGGDSGANGAGAPPPKSDQESPLRTASESDTAQLVHAGLGALTVPTKAWGYIGAKNLPGLALPTVQSVYNERAAYARAVSWAIAPEAQLLDRALRPGGSRLAQRILETRTGISDEQVALRVQDVALRVEDVHLRQEAVAQQHEASLLLGEFRRQIEKWTSLADWGIAFLLLTLLFSMAMTAWVVYLAGANKITAWALPAAIFTLALFAISPAVLLLRERPLKGIDEWKPDAKAGGDTAASSGDASSASPGTSPKSSGTAPSSDASVSKQAAASPTVR